MRQKLVFLGGFRVRANVVIKRNLKSYFPDNRDRGGGKARESDYGSGEACLFVLPEDVC